MGKVFSTVYKKHFFMNFVYFIISYTNITLKIRYLEAELSCFTTFLKLGLEREHVMGIQSFINFKLMRPFLITNLKLL